MTDYRFSLNEINFEKNDDGTCKLTITLDGKEISKRYSNIQKKTALRNFQEEYGKYPDNYKVLGVLPQCNFGGLAIMDIINDIDDMVISAVNYGDGYKFIAKNKIYYNSKGDAYFKRFGIRYYLDEFIRVR